MIVKLKLKYWNKIKSVYDVERHYLLLLDFFSPIQNLNYNLFVIVKCYFYFDKITILS